MNDKIFSRRRLQHPPRERNAMQLDGHAPLQGIGQIGALMEVGQSILSTEICTKESLLGQKRLHICAGGDEGVREHEH